MIIPGTHYNVDMNQGQQEENDTESRITAGMDTGNEDDNKISGIG